MENQKRVDNIVDFCRLFIYFSKWKNMEINKRAGAGKLRS